MVAEEIALNEALEANGIRRVETDLGEYIVQLAGETPSHILAPAIHMTKDRVATPVRRAPRHPRVEEPEALLAEARRALRQRYFEADVGITGANFLVAETGSVVLVTNEGNAELAQGLPKTHIVIASLEKVVPTFEDACTLLRVLARSATGQEFAAYTTVLTGPKRPADPRRPDQLPCGPGRQRSQRHARRRIPGHSALHPLRRLHESLPGLSDHRRSCLRLGLPGPMGAVLTPSFIGIEQAPSAQRLDLLRALRGVCPVRIPLPKMMRHWREQQFAKGSARRWHATARGCGRSSQAAGALSSARGSDRLLGRLGRGAVAFAACRSPAAGPARATFRRRRARPSRRNGAHEGSGGEQERVMRCSAACGGRWVANATSARSGARLPDGSASRRPT